jgi:hypothetical protein
MNIKKQSVQKVSVVGYIHLIFAESNQPLLIKVPPKGFVDANLIDEYQ